MNPKSLKAWAVTKNGQVFTAYVRMDRKEAVREARFFQKMNRKAGGLTKFGIRCFEVIQ